MRTGVFPSTTDPCDPAEAIRVLIVDDHAVVRQGLRTFLELHGEPSPGNPSALPIEMAPMRTVSTRRVKPQVSNPLAGNGAQTALILSLSSTATFTYMTLSTRPSSP